MPLTIVEETPITSPTKSLQDLALWCYELATLQQLYQDRIVKRLSYLTRRIVKLELALGLADSDLSGNAKLFANLIKAAYSDDPSDS